MTGSRKTLAWRRVTGATGRLCSLAAGRAGALMLETVVAVGVLSTLATAALIGLSATEKARANLDRQAVAENVIRNQMEYIFSLSYQTASAATQPSPVLRPATPSRPPRRW